MRNHGEIVAYLDNLPVYRESPDFAARYFLPDDEELESIFGPGGAAKWREMEGLLGRDPHPFLRMPRMR
jgi:hypothetical protein